MRSSAVLHNWRTIFLLALSGTPFSHGTYRPLSLKKPFLS